jgi:hypothetical protein
VEILQEVKEAIQDNLRELLPYIAEAAPFPRVPGADRLQAFENY